MKKDNLIYGIRPAIEAVQAGKTLDKVFIQKGLQGDLFRELRNLLLKTDVQIQYVPIEKLNRLTRQNHQGIVAFLSLIPYQDISIILPGLFEQGEIPMILVLDRISDVRNFGAIARTAECSGVQAIIIPNKESAQINEDAIKTSAGALHRIPVCKSLDLAETIKFLKESGLQVIAGTEKANDYYHATDLKLPFALVLGSEEDGISSGLIRTADQLVKIPIQGEIESLNVSVAAGIILFEAVRQRLG